MAPKEMFMLSFPCIHILHNAALRRKTFPETSVKQLRTNRNIITAVAGITLRKNRNQITAVAVTTLC